MKVTQLILLLVLLGRLAAQGAVPSISSFQPAFGAPGDTVRIFGLNFTANGTTQIQVLFGGGLQSASISKVSSGEIDVQVPTDATIGPILVQTSGGTAQSKTDFLAAPVISSFIRQTPVPATSDDDHRGNPGDTVFVQGLNFESGTGTPLVTAYLGAVPIPPNQTSARGSGALLVTVPATAVTGSLILSNKGGIFSTGSDYFYIPPVISSFTAKAKVGDQVTISGKSFLGVTNVQIGSVRVANFMIQGPTGTNITFTLPSTAPASGRISVISGGNISTPTQNFLLLPSVTGFSVPGGSPGASITLSGFGLTGTTNVSFNGVPSKPTTVTATSLTVAIPIGAVSGPITVSTPNGATTSPNTFFVAPRVANFTPQQGIPGDKVTVTGANFIGTTAVAFGGVAATDFTIQSPNSLVITVPPKTKTGTITITNPGGTGQSALSFVSFGTLPIVNGFTPAFGAPGSTVSITGLSFLSATGVRFNGSVATSFTSLSDTKITAIVPDGATTGPISVTGPDGTSTSAAYFIVGTNADLSLQMSVTPDSPVTGDSLTVNFTVSNSGPITAKAVMANFVGASVTTINQTTSTVGTANFTAKTASFSAGDLAVGANFSGTITLLANTNASFTLTMTVTSSTPDPQNANNTNSLSVRSNPIALSVFSPGPGSLHLSWPMVTSNYRLEKSSSLLPPAWTTVTDQPESDGTHYFLNLPTTGNLLFFRLRKQ